MKPSTLICFALFLAGVIISLAQLWFFIWPVDLFFKIIVTNGALFVVSLVFVFLIKENKQTEKIHKGSGLD